MLEEKEKVIVKRRILLTVLNLLAEQGLMEDEEKSRIKRNFAYGEGAMADGAGRDL